VNKITTFLKQSFSKITDSIGSLWNKMDMSMFKMVGLIGGAIAGIFVVSKILKFILGGIFSLIFNVGKLAINIIKLPFILIGKIISLLNPVNLILKTIKSKVFSTAIVIGLILVGLYLFSDKARKIIDNILKKIKTFGKWLWKHLKSFGNWIWDSLSDMFSGGGGSWIKKFGSWIWNKLTTFGNWIWDSLSNMFSGDGEPWIKKFGSWIWNKLTTFGNWIWDSLSDMFSGDGVPWTKKFGSWID
jgi:hypothetical protein